MTTSRDRILNKLRSAPQPFTDVPPRESYRHLVPNVSAEGLTARFFSEAANLGCKVTQHDSAESAIKSILDIIVGEGFADLLSWSLDKIPLAGLAEALAAAKIHIITADVGKETAAQARVGLTGVSAALASTGSLILSSGAGQSRSASLLPPVHIAVVVQNQIVADFESWITAHPDFRRASNHVVISGASRTADIAMETVMGVHGPGEVYVVIV